MWNFLSIEAIQNFFKVRDENGEYDRKQVKATAIQAALIVITLFLILLTLWMFGLV